MEFRYTKGQRLLIELTNNQAFEGDCEKCAKDRIDITNVREYPDGNKLQDSLSYYRCEIASVHVLHEENSKQTNKEVPHARKIIAVSQDEYQRLKDMTKKYIYLARVDAEYLKAINYLLNCEYVGVYGIYTKAGQTKKINLLMLSSWQQVYIFDLLRAEKHLPSDLKKVLESSDITKVVHDSRALFTCLWECYKVKLNNIFDTHVANLKLQKTETGCEPEKAQNLLECLEHYLNFPSTSVANAMEVGLKEWKERPLDVSHRVKAAQLVVYLITLKKKQDEMLLKGYYNAVATYSEILLNVDRYMAQKIVKSGDILEEVKKLL